jgi:N-carbamoylputrescine amidase
MKVTVCELPNEHDLFEKAWRELVDHSRVQRSEVVLLPEMPFFRWLAHTNEVRVDRWAEAVRAHEDWILKLKELAPAIMISTRPVINQGRRENVGFVWSAEQGIFDAHAKYYLPDEPGFWEASWYSRGSGEFISTDTSKCKIGLLICTELWFNKHAREYGKQGIQLLVCPRATGRPTVEKWVIGGQAAAVVSGAFCISSNLSGRTSAGDDFGGVGWIIDPDGKILGLTSTEKPFLTLDLDLSEADQAKKTYPRYVAD